MNRLIIYFGVLIPLMIAYTANGQRTVIGRFVDSETGKSVKDVSVVLVGKDVKTISNSLGYFQLEVVSAAILEITSSGYSTIQVQVPAVNQFKIELTKTTLNNNPSNESFTIYEQAPSFPGGDQEFFEYLKKNIKIPKEVNNGLVSGKVRVEFLVDSLGQIPLDKIKIVQGLCKSCDEEAIRLISESPKWNPGIQMDKPVNVLMNIPITFK